MSVASEEGHELQELLPSITRAVECQREVPEGQPTLISWLSRKAESSSAFG